MLCEAPGITLAYFKKNTTLHFAFNCLLIIDRIFFIIIFKTNVLPYKHVELIWITSYNVSKRVDEFSLKADCHLQMS